MFKVFAYLFASLVFIFSSGCKKKVEETKSDSQSESKPELEVNKDSVIKPLSEKKDDATSSNLLRDLNPALHAVEQTKKIKKRYNDKNSGKLLKSNIIKHTDYVKYNDDILPIEPSEEMEEGFRGVFQGKTISVNISDDIDVKDAISQIASISGLNVEVNPDIKGTVILSLNNKNPYDAFKSISSVADLKMAMDKNGIIRFSQNKPITINYSINFLDISRTSTTNYNLSTSVDSEGKGGTMDTIKSTHGSSAWQSLSDGLKNILSDHPNAKYSMNKQAGIISVSATDSVQRIVKAYIDKVRAIATTQILIEVKLVQVILNDDFSTGISLTLNDQTSSVSSAFSAVSSGTGYGTAVPFSYGLSNGNINAAVQALSRFGTTKTISSPRLNVINNQQALLSFATNQVYFQLTPMIQPTISGVNGVSGGQCTVSSTMKTVPIGVILALQAVANPDTSEVIMNIRPSISSISKLVDDPALVSIASCQTTSSNSTSSATSIKTLLGPTYSFANKIPVVEKKELDSVLRIKSGDVMVIGGFNEEQVSETDTGIPFLKNIPILGYLFSQKQKYVQNVETVIFIKATVFPSDSIILEKDQDFYDEFVQD